MKEDSKELWNWCKTIHKKTSLMNTLPSLTLSHKSNKLVTTLFKKLQQANSLSKKMMPTLPIETLTTLPEGNNFSYIKPSIQSIIRANCANYIRFTIRLPNREFVVHVCTENVKYSCSQKTRIRKILLWFLFVNEFVPSTMCSKTVDVFLYCISSKKYLPSMKLEAIDEHHVNTAFTTSCDLHTSVYIYREEEWYRALIHESFHNLGLDSLAIDKSIIEREEAKLKTYFPAVSISDLRFNETYCEIWGRLLNSMIFTILHPTVTTTTTRRTRPKNMKRYSSTQSTQTIQSNRNLRMLIARWKQNIICERVFSIIQCVKLLNHFNISYSDLIDRTKVSQYTEKTQGFSYFVLTSIFMVFLSDFLEFCAPHENNHITVNFTKTEENFIRYTDIIKNNYSSVIMTNTTSIVYDELKKMGEISPLLNTNLRMSLLEA
jgi:hypothetical protein